MTGRLNKQWRLDYQHTPHQTQPNLRAVKIGNIDDTLEWLGNYTARGNIPIVLIPERSSCLPWLYVPNSTYAVITKNGKFDSIKKEGGIVYCLPWTRIEFLITKQDLIHSYRVQACPTYDNIYVELDLSVIFRCKQDDESIYNFCYRISINQLNEQLEAAITERVRVLIRAKTHLELYQIKGKHDTIEMKDFLNEMFNPKGLEFMDFIVTNVMLPKEIREPLDMKAQFGSLVEMEKEKFNYDMRIINDNEELELLKQRRAEQRDSITQDFRKQLELEERELQKVRANAEKSVAYIKSKGQNEQAEILAAADLKCEQIYGQTLITKLTNEATGESEADIIFTDSNNQSLRKVAEKKLEIADIKAQTTQTIGQGEAQISNVMQSRRKFEFLNKKLDLIKQLKNQDNIKIFGDNNDEGLTQMAAYSLMNKVVR